MEEDKSYFYLYRISYMWYCPLGFLIAVITGWFVSWITRLIFGESLTEIDSVLLSPIIVNRIQKRKEVTKHRNMIKLNKG